ncbi:RNA polymerase II elongation factor ELL2-like [Eucyclogobius newberryi]|uniref:RNA polymerase II elongation factor ELL2-like n=1 Tax=Eucyclogobius newberryi TaxID=166745 RepID=UPI003B5B99ED
MASLRQEHHYGLSCGKKSQNSPNRTLYHVKLTDSALRALEAFQNIKGSIHCEPSICFKGSQGYIKIPAPTSEAPSALRVFTFYLSTDSKDQPQASFDCIHQYASSDGHEQLEGQGFIQDKITVCATDDSYQTTRERVSQVEKDSWNRSVIEIKPGHPGWSSKFPKRNVQSLPGPDTLLKQSIQNRRVSGGAGPSWRRLRERIIHLLALKPYRKPELLLWLEKERASPKDKVELGTVLDEVAKLNPKDNSYCLQDALYKHVQKDWPGYSEEEKQLIGRVLARKLPNIQSRNLLATTSLQTSPENTTLNQSPKKNPNMKRPVALDCSQEKILAKRQKLLTKSLPQGPVSEDLNTPSLIPSFHTKTEFQRTCNLTSNYNNSLESSNSIPLMHKVPDAVVSDTVKQDSIISSSPWTKAHSECTKEQFANHQHKKKKSKKHKDRERERIKDNQAKWMETSPDLKQHMDKLDTPDIKEEVTSDEKPDYILLYSPIMDLEQRMRYQEDFCAEYDEYKDLHSRIATITHMFVQLGAKIKSLSPGTKEYKIMEDQILEKYSKYKKKFPGYREEKKRCKYLHEKLSYIKQLITDYDIAQTC